MGARFHHWELGFNQFRLNHTHRTCSTSPYIPSCLAAFPAMLFSPLLFSARLGRCPRRCFALSLLLLWSYLVSAKAAHSNIAHIANHDRLYPACLEGRDEVSRLLMLNIFDLLFDLLELVLFGPNQFLAPA